MATQAAIAAFFEESDTHLELAESSLLALEKNGGNREHIDELFRAVHSLKGNAGLVGLGGIHSIATEMETILDEARQSGQSVGQEKRDLLFELLDKVKLQVEDARQHQTGDAEKPSAPDKSKITDGKGDEKTAVETKQSQAGNNGNGGKRIFLSFMLRGEYYGVPITFVREIIIRRKITRVPKATDFIAGVMNLRGVVVPVMDAKKKLGFKNTDEDKAESIIIVEKDGFNTGVLVDKVEDIVTLDGNKIVSADKSMGGIKSGYLSGIGQAERNNLLILDLNVFCSSTDKFY
ncbi:MAG: hypothetical protein IEMM0002_0818 [bacterium]|nr:MAG: hypothetical protein IEMM0002_0818 [bacterium]